MNTTSSATSSRLLQQIKERDEAAWQKFIQIYGPLVYRLCRVAGIPSEDAHDVGQEVFRGVARNVNQFQYRHPNDSFRSWLLGITRNKICDYFRDQAVQPAAVGGTDVQRQLEQIPDIDWSTSDDGTGFDSDSSVVQRAIDAVRNEFEARTWETFCKVAIEGRDPQQVAEELGVSAGAIYKAKSRVIRRLRQELQGLLV